MTTIDGVGRYRVLFVCSGNTCRSPTAHGLLRQRLRAAGLAERVAVDSAGTHGQHAGDPPDPRSRTEAMRRGLDIADLRSRELTAADFTGHDLYVAMDEGHVRFLVARLPAARHGAVRLLLDFIPEAGRREVPDPYYGGPADYRLAYELIERGVDALIGRLEADLAPHRT